MSEQQSTTQTDQPTQGQPQSDQPDLDRERRVAMAATIAAQLGETGETPCAQIRRALKVLGAEQVQALLQEALSIEAGEGILIRDGSRRRTLGGVFFYLLR